LRCPCCGAGDLELQVEARDAREVRSGSLRCRCGGEYRIARGVADLLQPDNEVIEREIRGWREIAGFNQHDMPGADDPAMRADLMALPWGTQPPWIHVAPDFFQLFEYFDLRGTRIVDLGAGRTWSSRYLAAFGGAEVIAVDPMLDMTLGLHTADIYLERNDCYFERLRADMHRLPLADGWADVVFGCATLHHSSDLERLMGEVARVLRRGGLLLAISEPNKRAAILQRRPDNAETAAGINEQIYTLAEYFAAARSAGLRPRAIVPRTVRQRMLYGESNLREGLDPWLVRLLRRRCGLRLVDLMLRVPILLRWIYRRSNLPLSFYAVKA
jgi:SAM-dependent methyltransferase